MEFLTCLDALIPKLSRLKRDPAAAVFYDAMSGALVWADEKLGGLPVEEMGCLRAIFRVRTGIITGESETRFPSLWDELRAKCPHWIGFDPARCSANRALTELYHQEKTSSARSFQDLL